MRDVLSRAEADWLRSIQSAPRRDPEKAVAMLAMVEAPWSRNALAWAAQQAPDKCVRVRARRALKAKQ